MHLFEESVRVPMIMAGPGIAAGQVCTTPVSLVDLAPTIMDAVGADPYDWAADLPGRSLFEIAAAPDDATRTVFSEYHAFASPSATFMLRNGRFKYNHYVGYEPELFDLQLDPGEERNLAADPGHATILAGFVTQLRGMLDPDAVDAQVKADQAALIARFGGPEMASNIGAPGATPAPI